MNNNDVLLWDIYEISSVSEQLHGIDFRGRLREFSLDKTLNLLVDNADDKKNVVRFAILANQDSTQIEKYVQSLVSDARVSLEYSKIMNPSLSSMWVNRIEIKKS